MILNDINRLNSITITAMFDRKPLRSLCVAAWIAAWIGTVPAHGLDLHLQELPPAPGLRPSDALDPLEGVRDAANCGLDFLNTAKACGLSAPSETASPFLVRFDPMFCRLTMRFSIGELIDGLLKQWLAGAFARLNSPAIGALCLLGIGPQFCGASATATPLSFDAAVRPGAVSSKAALPPTPARQQQLEAIRQGTTQNGAMPLAPIPPAASPSSLDTPPESNSHERTGLDSLTR